MNTNKKLFIGAAVIALALVSVSMVSADTTGMGPGDGGFGRGYGEEDGLLAEYMQAVIAESLGLTVDALNALEENGITHLDIALEKGFTAEEFNAILDNAREEAIALAAADGITIQAFGMNADGSGQFGSGMRAEDGSRGGYGSRLMNAEDCTEETCTAQPSGSGIGRGRRR